MIGIEIIFISGIVELSIFRSNNLRSYLTILGVIKLFIYMINIDRYIKLCKTIIKLGQIEMIQNRGKNRCMLLIELNEKSRMKWNLSIAFPLIYKLHRFLFVRLYNSIRFSIFISSVDSSENFRRFF